MNRQVVLSLPDNPDKKADLTISNDEWAAILTLVRRAGGLEPYGNLRANHAKYFGEALTRALANSTGPATLPAHRASTQFIRAKADFTSSPEVRKKAEAVITLCEQGKGLLIHHRFAT